MHCNRLGPVWRKCSSASGQNNQKSMSQLVIVFNMSQKDVSYRSGLHCLTKSSSVFKNLDFLLGGLSVEKTLGVDSKLPQTAERLCFKHPLSSCIPRKEAMLLFQVLSQEVSLPPAFPGHTMAANQWPCAPSRPRKFFKLTIWKHVWLFFSLRQEGAITSCFM